MGLFKGQFADVVEWEEQRDDVLFYKWCNKEIKKGSRLVIRAGQDAVFLYNGRKEGIFTEEGSYDMESEIIPFLSSLKGFKFGFNSGLRAEVLFINTKEFTVRWGTKNPVLIPTEGLVGGLPIRARGTFNCKAGDYLMMIEKIAGIKQQFTIDDIKERVLSVLDQLLMKWISREGKNMFNLQANAYEISKGIQEDLDMEMVKIGLSITGFQVESFNYPEEIQGMIEKVASQSMVGDMARYQQMTVLDAMANSGQGAGVASDMAGMQMGMMMGQQMVNNMTDAMNRQSIVQSVPVQPGAVVSSGSAGQNSQPQMPNFCPNCGQKTTGANFCPNCGQKLV
ncbi:MAG: SPFH domain-containing protein [Lachnospiraceae bacterium]|nr:SPFH domain-containing protein [Lachnospiraceae bacterium]